MNEIQKVKSIALWIFIIPFFALNACLILITQFHGLFPNQEDIILNTIVESVALDEKIEIRGFGTFSKKYIRPRKFVNPKTKEVSYLGETATMHFKTSKALIKK